MDTIESKLLAELPPGTQISVTRTLAPSDVEIAAAMLETTTPDPHVGDAAGTGCTPTGAHWAEGMINGIVSRELPGPGSRILSQTLSFPAPSRIGDRVTVTLAVTAVDAPTHRLVLRVDGRDQSGRVTLEGEVVVQPPSERRRVRKPETLGVTVRTHQRYHDLLAACAGLPALRTAVVHPCDEDSLSGALTAAKEHLIEPVLIGPRARIEDAAAEAGLELAGIELIDVEHSTAAAIKAVALARSGSVQAVMKGALHTDELMHEVMSGQTGLRTGQRMSHVFVMNVPTYPRPLLITDAAINIYPTLEDKRDICQNAIDLALALGIALPKVAILSAVETVHPKITSTIEAAALCKMADRGQIKGGVLDGPLAFDNAISEDAARTKNIVSPVAGRADILLVPDLEAGNMLAKQLAYLANADAAGIVLGARVPIMLTSRADDTRTRLASCAVALMLQRHRAIHAPVRS